MKTDKRLERPRTGFKPVVLNPFPMDLWIEARKKSIEIDLAISKVGIRLFDGWVKGKFKI